MKSRLSKGSTYKLDDPVLSLSFHSHNIEVCGIYNDVNAINFNALDYNTAGDETFPLLIS